MPEIIEDVIYQHAENVSALWVQRSNAVHAPHYMFTDLEHLDSRVEANLDGLRIAGDQSLLIIEENISGEEIGGYFAKSVLLLERDAGSKFYELAEGHSQSRNIFEELMSALTWVNPKYLSRIVKDLLSSSEPTLIELGLTACAAHQKPARKHVQVNLNSDNANLRATAMEVAANLGLTEFGGLLSGVSDFESDRERFHCGRALAFLGEQKAGSKLLESIVTSDSFFSSKALNLLALMNDTTACKALLKSFDATGKRERDVIRGFGFLGDPAAVEWLISKTDNPNLSRLAGGSISMITGIDLADNDLETLGVPEGFLDAGPNDDPSDGNVALDEDEDLPWPDLEQVRRWWQSSAKLPAGKQYLNGREKTEIEMQIVLKEAFQRQRSAAADSLALLNPTSTYLDPSLPTGRQRHWM